MKGKKLEVLGNGFVQLIDYMGTDEDIVKAARKSYTLEDDYGPEKTERLIRYMMRKGHTSPFEQVELKFLVRVPMDVWRQWIRHRTASVNEYSTRYSEAINNDPLETPFRKQSKNNKQGSSGLLSPGLDAGYRNKEHELNDSAWMLYHSAVDDGMAKEQARRFLPLSTWTEAVWKIDLHNLFHFLNLRLDPHAQYEIRQYAQALSYFASRLFPIAYQAFVDYKLDAITLSVDEQALMGECLRHIDGFVSKVDTDMTKSEMNDFNEKYGRMLEVYNECL